MNLNILTNDELIAYLSLQDSLTDTEHLLLDRLTGAMDALHDMEKKDGDDT